MTDLYPRPELPGQGSLLDLQPRPRPHQGVRAAVLQTLETAPGPVDSHWIAARIGNYPNVVARRLGELEDDRLAYRAGEHHGPTGRPRTLWKAT